MSDLQTRVSRQLPTVSVTVAGEIDVATARSFRDCVVSEIGPGVEVISLDGRGITLLSADGITALVDVTVACRDHDVRLDLGMSPSARKVLDVVGLWWLGVIDDGIEIETALQAALRDYASARTIELIELQEKGLEPS